MHNYSKANRSFKYIGATAATVGLALVLDTFCTVPFLPIAIHWED